MKLWDSWGFSEILGDSPRFFEIRTVNLQESLRIRQRISKNLWESCTRDWDSLGFFVILWGSLRFFGILRDSLRFFENQTENLWESWTRDWDSLGFFGILRDSLGFSKKHSQVATPCGCSNGRHLADCWRLIGQFKWIHYANEGWLNFGWKWGHSNGRATHDQGGAANWRQEINSWDDLSRSRSWPKRQPKATSRFESSIRVAKFAAPPPSAAELDRWRRDISRTHVADRLPPPLRPEQATSLIEIQLPVAMNSTWHFWIFGSNQAHDIWLILIVPTSTF